MEQYHDVKVEKAEKGDIHWRRYSKYPFHKMNYGDSFWVHAYPDQVRQCAYNYRKKHDKEAFFSCRKEFHGNVLGTRCVKIFKKKVKILNGNV